MYITFFIIIHNCSVKYHRHNIFLKAKYLFSLPNTCYDRNCIFDITTYIIITKDLPHYYNLNKTYFLRPSLHIISERGLMLIYYNLPLEFIFSLISQIFTNLVTLKLRMILYYIPQPSTFQKSIQK